MIKLRIDVDYPYPSRLRSFIYTALEIKVGKDYLKNSKILARMINDSPKQVKAYWFFTFQTVPDEEMLHMLNDAKHEIALHVVNHSYTEMAFLEEATKKKVRYYTIHGTSRLMGKILWKRWKAKTPLIPQDFPLQSFHQFPTVGLDRRCYANSTAEAVEIAKDSIAEGKILELHPEWLFQRGTINLRGPYYKVLRHILEVDHELEKLVVQKRLFVNIGHDAREYQKDVYPTETLVEKLKEMKVDIFTFIARKWAHTIPNPPKSWSKTEDNIALLQVPSYQEWWRNIGKKTRNMVRKADKNGVITRVLAADKELAEGIWRIYDETPVRQGRAFPHYGVALKTVKRRVLSAKNSTFIGSYVGDELAGFIQLVHGDKIVITSQILSLQKHWDKAVNNALLAKAIEVCADQQVKWLMYGRMGNHPSLDKFKKSNGFTRFPLSRYFIPLTKKGEIAVKLGLYKEIKDYFPQQTKYFLIPIYNWISRIKQK